MIPRIKDFKVLDNLKLRIEFDDKYTVIYDVMDDIQNIPSYKDLLQQKDLFQQAKVDTSRTIIYWNDYIDLPSDMLYEYGQKIS